MVRPRGVEGATQRPGILLATAVPSVAFPLIDAGCSQPGSRNREVGAATLPSGGDALHAPNDPRVHDQKRQPRPSIDLDGEPVLTCRRPETKIPHLRRARYRRLARTRLHRACLPLRTNHRGSAGYRFRRLSRPLLPKRSRRSSRSPQNGRSHDRKPRLHKARLPLRRSNGSSYRTLPDGELKAAACAARVPSLIRERWSRA